MSNPILQLLVLAGIAVFLILRLKSVLGTRDGFESKPKPLDPTETQRKQPSLEVIEGGPDPDITDHAEEGSATAKALADMKRAEPSFNVGEFLQGARGAYEMILMGFENGDLDEIQAFLAPEVYQSFAEVIEARESKGLEIEAEFIGLRELTLQEAQFDANTREGEMTVRFVGELTSVVRNGEGEIVEGSPTAVKRQKDSWTFARRMGSDDPNWQLVATGA